MKFGSVLLGALLCVASSSRLLPQHPDVARGNASLAPASLDRVPVTIVIPRKTNSTQLFRRAAKPLTSEAWEKLRVKGCNLLQAMAATDKDAATWLPGRTESAESPYQNFPDDLTSWCYSQQDTIVAFRRAAPSYQEAYKGYGLDPAKELGGNKHGPNVAVAYVHDKATEHDKVKYEPTQANFKNIVNTKDGVMIGWYKFRARYNGGQQFPPVTVLPKLQNWFDIAFLFWKSQGGGSNLQYIWSATISNTDFPGIIGHALSESVHRDKEISWTPFDEDKECEKYKWTNRVEMGMDTYAGKALLGSPNGRVAGHLLLEHKKTFGDKTTIGSVTFYCAFNKDEDPELTMIFQVLPAT